MASRCILLLLLTLAGLVSAPLTITFAGESKTSKERLSDKASDNQRVDNCRVPLKLRGSTPRPDCEPEPSTPTAGQSTAGPLKPHYLPSGTPDLDGAGAIE
jgi:hypothetical protein